LHWSDFNSKKGITRTCTTELVQKRCPTAGTACKQQQNEDKGTRPHVIAPQMVVKESATAPLALTSPTLTHASDGHAVPWYWPVHKQECQIPSKAKGPAGVLCVWKPQRHLKPFTAEQPLAYDRWQMTYRQAQQINTPQPCCHITTSNNRIGWKSTQRGQPCAAAFAA
jgi:hypothetical protein